MPTKIKMEKNVRIYFCDALTALPEVETASVQACITSPPFYLLRRYGTAVKWPDGWEGELGHEPHPHGFITHLLAVFDEVWRVLKKDGVLWVNLADTYNNKQGKKGTTNAPDGSNGKYGRGGRRYAADLRKQPEFFKHYIPGIAHKSELGVPFRFHLALTDPAFRAFIGAQEGPQWICRRTVIWAKSLVNVQTQTGEGNAMPEPTKDRTSRNYEFLFLFCKQPSYYFDRTAIDLPARSSMKAGELANAGSVWEADEIEVNGIQRLNAEASPYRHVAMWPRELVRQMMLPATREGDTVLDPFAGSGTTGEVALGFGRKAILIESSRECRQTLEDRIGRAKQTLF